jgi:hypothetical protein
MSVSKEQLTATNLVELIELLQKIVEVNINADINAVSIDDNNGGRIIM